MSQVRVGLFVITALCFALPALAVDGVVLINQATVTAAGGFPYKITQPGSYRLSGNLVVSTAGTDAIDILADGVTIDLNGFTISGPIVCSGFPVQCGPSAGVASAIVTIENPPSSGMHANSIVVRNGIVRGFQFGVSLEGKNNTVEEVTATGNTLGGIFVNFALVRRNNASLNGGDGIAASWSVVTENVANGNNGYGMNLFAGTFGSNTMDFDFSGALTSKAAVSQGNNDCGTGAVTSSTVPGC